MTTDGASKIDQAFAWLCSGRPEDMELAISALQSSVYSFGMKVCGNHFDAEDTAQETLIRLARSLNQFPNARALAVWLYKVAKTQCLMSRRKSKFAPKQMLSLEAVMPLANGAKSARARSWAITAEELAIQSECRERLEKAVLLLPRPYRLVLVLRDMEQLNTKEVAEVMEISENTVRVRLHRARAFVRNQLDRYMSRARGGAQ